MKDSLHVVCPACHAVNRLPAGRLRDAPICGQCHLALFAGHPAALTAQSFRKHLRHSDLPVVVDFWAPWCGPCLAMAPAYEQAATALEPEFRLAKVDTESEPALGNELAIRSIPTLVLFEQGREVARHSGALGARDIVHWVRSASGRD